MLHPGGGGGIGNFVPGDQQPFEEDPIRRHRYGVSVDVRELQWRKQFIPELLHSTVEHHDCAVVVGEWRELSLPWLNDLEYPLFKLYFSLLPLNGLQ